MLLMLLPAAAVAHAELVVSDPAQGDTIVTPYTMTATFSEALNVERSRIVVRDATGTEVARGGATQADATSMSVELPQLTPGVYAAQWTAVAADGHVTRGRIDFIVEPAPTPSAVPSPTPAATPTGPPTATPTVGPTPVATPTQSPPLQPLPQPTPGENGQPTAGGTDLLIALLGAGVIVGAVFLLLWRRRAA
jgi:copper resistance protein C